MDRTLQQLLQEIIHLVKENEELKKLILAQQEKLKSLQEATDPHGSSNT